MAAQACMIVAQEAPPPYEILSHQRRFRHAQTPRDGDLMGVLHLEHAHAVDVLGVEAGVVERELDGLDGGIADRPPDVLGERQMTDADDRHAIPDAGEEVAVEHVLPFFHHKDARTQRTEADDTCGPLCVAVSLW